MKKTTLTALYNYFVNSDDTIDLPSVVEDIRAEYEKTAAKVSAKMDAYAMAKPVVLAAIKDAPLTVKEIFAACEGLLPDDFSANKIQYALLHYWSDEVTKISNGKSPFTYQVK